MRTPAAILVILSAAMNASAQWQGWPLPTGNSNEWASLGWTNTVVTNIVEFTQEFVTTNTTPWTTNSCQVTNVNVYITNFPGTNVSPILQLYSAIVERCQAAGVATPTTVVTWTWYAGMSNYIGTTNFITTNTTPWTTNACEYTNSIAITTNIVLTNQWTPYAYQYTVTGATITATGTPTITRQAMVDLDSKIFELIPYFVNTNGADAAGILTNYFYRPSNYLGCPWDVNVWCKGGLFSQLRVGAWWNVTSNAWLEAQDGTGSRPIWTDSDPSFPTYSLSGAEFTREPERAWGPLAELHWSAESWKFNDCGTLPTNVTATNILIYLTYFPFRTNLSVQPTVKIYGKTYNPATRSVSTTDETIAMTSSNTACVKLWQDVTNMTATGANGQTGDVIRLHFTNTIASYGIQPWVVYAQDLNERQQVLNALKWTTRTPNATDIAESQQEVRSTNGYFYVPDPPTDNADNYAHMIADWTASTWEDSPGVGWYIAAGMMSPIDYWWDVSPIRTAKRVRSTPAFTNLYTNAACDLDVYASITPYSEWAAGYPLDNHDIDSMGYGVHTNTLWPWHTWNNTTKALIGGDTTIGNYSAMPASLFTPTMVDVMGDGYDWEGPQLWMGPYVEELYLIFRWDFRYK